jgi:Arc/MetJ family transcription regulator
MKRTNVVLDESLLEEAVRVSGERTYSAAINRALKELIDRAKARQILTLAGSGLWQGELSAVREDRPEHRLPKRGRGSR